MGVPSVGPSRVPETGAILKSNAPQQKPGIWSRIKKFIVELLSKVPKAITEFHHKVMVLRSDRRVTTAVKNIFASKTGLKNEGDIDRLSPEKAKELADNQSLKNYLLHGKDVAKLRQMGKIYCKAHLEEWRTVDQEKERVALTRATEGKSDINTKDILRTPCVKINEIVNARSEDMAIDLDNRMFALRAFANHNDDYVKQLSHALHQVTMAGLTEKIFKTLLENNIFPAGRLTGLEFKRDGSQLILKAVTNFQCRINEMDSESQDSFLFDLGGTVTIKVDEEAFKKGDYSNAQFTYEVEIKD